MARTHAQRREDPRCILIPRHQTLDNFYYASALLDSIYQASLFGSQMQEDAWSLHHLLTKKIQLTKLERAYVDAKYNRLDLSTVSDDEEVLNAIKYRILTKSTSHARKRSA